MKRKIWTVAAIAAAVTAMSAGAVSAAGQYDSEVKQLF